MLTALEQGVLGGKWFSLMDKVYALANLRQAFARVKGNGGAAGVDHVTVQEFEHHLETNLAKLSQALKDGSYRPQAIRRVSRTRETRLSGSEGGGTEFNRFSLPLSRWSSRLG